MVTEHCSMPRCKSQTWCRKDKPADGSQGSDFIDRGKKPVSIEGVEMHKQEGNEHFKAGEYLHAAASYTFGLSILNKLGTLPTISWVPPVMHALHGYCDHHLFKDKVGRHQMSLKQLTVSCRNEAS